MRRQLAGAVAALILLVSCTSNADGPEGSTRTTGPVEPLGDPVVELESVASLEQPIALAVRPDDPPLYVALILFVAGDPDARDAFGNFLVIGITFGGLAWLGYHYRVAFVDARMMAWLLEQLPGIGFEILDGWLMVFRPRATTSVEDLARALELFDAFMARIPEGRVPGPARRSGSTRLSAPDESRAR